MGPARQILDRALEHAGHAQARRPHQRLEREARAVTQAHRQRLGLGSPLRLHQLFPRPVLPGKVAYTICLPPSEELHCNAKGNMMHW